ncbi:hypothetical protein AYI68_g4680 [Smittium mucronatum]|nr:hypothetical protein AYI68_g4680 [Smittium mucronatum]
MVNSGSKKGNLSISSTRIARSRSFTADLRHISDSTVISAYNSSAFKYLKSHSSQSALGSELNELAIDIFSENAYDKNNLSYYGTTGHHSYISEIRHSEIFTGSNISELHSKNVNTVNPSPVKPFPSSNTPNKITENITHVYYPKPNSSRKSHRKNTLNNGSSHSSDYDLHDALSLPIDDDDLLSLHSFLSDISNSPNPQPNSSQIANKPSRASTFSFRLSFLKPKRSSVIPNSNSNESSTPFKAKTFSRNKNSHANQYGSVGSSSKTSGTGLLHINSISNYSSFNKSFPTPSKALDTKNTSFSHKDHNSHFSSQLDVNNPTSNLYGGRRLSETCNTSTLSISHKVVYKKTFPKKYPKPPTTMSSIFKLEDDYVSDYSSSDSSQKYKSSRDLPPSRRSTSFFEFIISETEKQRKRALNTNLLELPKPSHLPGNEIPIHNNKFTQKDIYDSSMLLNGCTEVFSSSNENINNSVLKEKIKLKFVPVSLFMNNFPSEPTIETFLTAGVDFKLYNSTLIINRTRFSSQIFEGLSFPKFKRTDFPKLKDSEDLSHNDGGFRNKELTLIASPSSKNSLIKDSNSSESSEIRSRLPRLKTISKTPADFFINVDGLDLVDPKSSLFKDSKYPNDMKLREILLANRETLITNLSKIDQKLRGLEIISEYPASMSFLNKEPLKRVPASIRISRIRTAKSMDYLRQVKKTNRKIKLTLMSKKSILEIRKENLLMPIIPKSVKLSNSKLYRNEADGLDKVQKVYDLVLDKRFSRDTTFLAKNKVSLLVPIVSPHMVNVNSTRKRYSRSLSHDSPGLIDPIKSLEAKRKPNFRKSLNPASISSNKENSYKRSINPGSIITIKGSINSIPKLFRSPSIMIKESDENENV